MCPHVHLLFDRYNNSRIYSLAKYLSNGLPVYAPIRPILSLYLNTPPRAQLEVPFSSSILRFGFSRLHASLVLLDPFDSTRLGPLGRLVCSYGPSQLPCCCGIGASSVALSTAWPSSDSDPHNQIARLNQLSSIGYIRPCLGIGLLLISWLWLQFSLLVTPPVSVIGFFSRSELEFFIWLGSNVFFSPSPPQVQHVEVLQPKSTREFP